jgi:hypothetical protein
MIDLPQSAPGSLPVKQVGICQRGLGRGWLGGKGREEAGGDHLKGIKASSSSKWASGFDPKIKQEFKRTHLTLHNLVLKNVIFNVRLQCIITLKE